jgi:hypothetical protein
MAELYVTEFPAAPDTERRFGTFGNPYSGFQSIHFVPLNKVIFRDGNGRLTCAKSLSWCRRMTDDCRAAVAQGWSQKWLGSARVLKYLSASNSFELVYDAVAEVTAAIDNPSGVQKAWDGTFRKIPLHLCEKTFRGWRLKFAIIDSGGVPRADYISGATKAEIVEKLRDSTYQLSKDIMSSFPLAHPSEIPDPVAPVTEYVPTEAELAAVQPLNYTEWTLIPSSEHKRRYAFDPLYREAFKKMLVVQAAAEEKFAQQQAKEKETEELEKLKKQFLSADEDARRKEAHR